jgi:hypothetical protein
MSFYDSYIDLAIEDLQNQATVSKEIHVSYASLLDVPDTMKRLDYLIYIETDDKYYRWDATIGPSGDWEVAIASATSDNTTVTNVGAGLGKVFKQLVGSNVELKSIQANNNKVSIVNNTDNVTIGINEANIDHELLLNIGINSHSAIDSHISSTLNPHNVTKNQLSLGNVENLKVNLVATVAPSGLNDLSQGYQIGSRWFNTLTQKEYVGVDFSVIGSAVWKETTQGGATTLAGLTDVDIITIPPVNGDAIIYNGTKFVSSSTTSEQDLTTNLLLNCSFNVNANDNSTFASAGSLIGTVTQIATGKLGNAYNFFSGTGQHYINYGVQSRFNFQINNSWSVACWIRTNVTGPIERILCSNSEGINGSGWSVTLANPSNGRFEMQLKDNTTIRGVVARWELGAIVTDNAWHYVVFVHRGVNGWTGSSMDMYFDGVVQTLNKTVPTNSLLNTDSITSVGIPFNIASRNSGEGNSWIGDIDQFSIFNFPLIASQIRNTANTSLYNNGLGKETFEVTTISQHDHPISDIRLLQPALDTKLENITSANTFLTTISGTGTTRTITPLIGANQPIYLEFFSPAQNGSQISANATLTASVSQLTIGWNPVNRDGTKSEYVKHQYDYLRQNLPCYLRLVDITNTGSYVSYNINTFAGTGAFNYSFNVSHILADSTLTSFVSTTKFHVIFEPIPNVKTLTGTSEQVTATSTNRNVVLSNPSAGRNTIFNCDVRILNLGSQYGFTKYAPALISSVDVLVNSGGGLNHCLSLGSVIAHHKMLNQKTSTGPSVAVQLTGTYWAGGNINNLFLGFMSKGALSTINNWATTASIIGHDLVYNNTGSSQERAMWLRFETTNAQATQIGGGFGNINRTGFVSNSFSAQNDVIMVYMENSFNIKIQWLEASTGYSIKSTGNIQAYGGGRFLDNFMSSDVNMIVSSAFTASNAEFRILSERDMIALSVPMFGNFGYLY